MARGCHNIGPANQALRRRPSRVRVRWGEGSLMAKKERARKGASTTKPKKLRKQLRKAEVGLAKAQTKRDRAQARVEALSIIADEIRAQIAESEKAAPASKAATSTDGTNTYSQEKFVCSCRWKSSFTLGDLNRIRDALPN